MADANSNQESWLRPARTAQESGIDRRGYRYADAGIGATTAIYTVVYAVLLAPLPYPHPEQLVMVWSKVNGGRNPMAAGDFLDWKEQSKSFQQLAAWTGATFNLATQDQPEPIDGMRSTPGWFSLQGMPFLMERDFRPEEGMPGGDRAVILTHKLWNRLGANRGIVGGTLRVNGEPYTVVGASAAGVGDRFDFEMAVPLAFRPVEINHDYHWLLAMGRLKPGVTLQQAQADMDAVTAHLAEAYPITNQHWGASVEPLQNDFLPPERIRNLWLLLGAVGFVLVIACVNIANLLLAKGAARLGNAIRSSVGASRDSFRAISYRKRGAGADRRRSGDRARNGIAARNSNHCAGGHPALGSEFPTGHSRSGGGAGDNDAGRAAVWLRARFLRLARRSGRVAERGRTLGTGTGSHKLRRGFIVGEFALALSLLAGAGIAIHSFWNLTRVDLGLRTDHVLTFALDQPQGRFKTPEEMRAYNQQVLGALRSVPGYPLRPR